MKSFRALLVAASLLSSSIGAAAAPLSLNQFDGTESLIDFNALPGASGNGPVTFQGVTFTAQSNKWMVQPAGGSIIGTSGGAFNTDSYADNADLTLTFETSISRFGMNFGTSTGLTFLSAIVTAYEANGAVVESLTLQLFDNSFVGFDFNAFVSKIVIDRIDRRDQYTFIDDVRFVSNDIAEELPEPGSIVLICVGALAGVLARRRRN